MYMKKEKKVYSPYEENGDITYNEFHKQANELLGQFTDYVVVNRIVGRIAHDKFMYTTACKGTERIHSYQSIMDGLKIANSRLKDYPFKDNNHMANTYIKSIKCLLEEQT